MFGNGHDHWLDLHTVALTQLKISQNIRVWQGMYTLVIGKWFMAIILE